MLNYYKNTNNVVGWIVFAISAFVYLSTIEPTASFWDCGEYIATAYKLQVGHPPGAPTFQLIGRVFSMFVPTDSVGMMINAMSGLASAFTILFLFWSITAIAKKLVIKTETDFNKLNVHLVMVAGAVGALAYTFSDSFWFSAVEGEVYAMSSFFTAIVFWCILKWEEKADDPKSIKWIVFIAYLVGLSIGVHLLNLLAIPAIVFVYYFKKYQPTTKGIITALAISVVMLGGILYGVIPQIVNQAALFERTFVNTFGLPFNSGTIFFFTVLIGAIIYGIYYTQQKKKLLYNTILLSFAFLLIGYSTFFIIIIRSQADTPINENNPKDAVSLLAYLNREQYGDSPLFYGQYYNAPLDSRQPYKDGKPVYRKDEAAGKYVITDDRKGSIPNYDEKFKTIFPRMHSSQRNHVSGYKLWADIEGTPVRIRNNRGETETIQKPTFGENLTFFFRYQLGFMYFRYFMWNFAGRQNDWHGQVGNTTDGNWISGIKFLDEFRLGSQNYPINMESNKAKNTFFLLPLILGILGLVYQYKKNQESAFVVFLLFFFTGIAIVIFLNNTPFQPRERDYAYVGSFYAFAMWIGLGVIAIFDFLRNKIPDNINLGLTAIATLLLVPGLMAKEGWDDHDRSDRYTARDFAKNYLNSCAPNGMIFTNGDNDTFPLWYVQEVEGFRTDVRVINMSLLNTDWYITQMKNKVYDSDPIPFKMEESKYIQGTRDYLPIMDKGISGYVDIKSVFDFITSDKPETKVKTQGGKSLDYIPTSKIFVNVDKEKVLANGTVSPDMADQVVDRLEFEITKSYILKNEMMILDLLANNDWERPIYFAITAGTDNYMNLQKYFQIEGLAYRLVPILNGDKERGQTGRVHADIMYDNLMNKFVWGGMDSEKEIFMDENNLRMTMNFRNNFYRLANTLYNDGDKERALAVLNRGMEVMPEHNVPLNYFSMPFAELYLKLGEKEKARHIYTALIDLYADDLRYYSELTDFHASSISNDIEQRFQIMRQMMFQLGSNKEQELMEELKNRLTVLNPNAAQNKFFRASYERYFTGVLENI